MRNDTLINIVTMVVQIGNSDNKLSQEQWSYFIRDVYSLLDAHGTIHFSGGSDYNVRWQNACFVVELAENYLGYLRQKLSNYAEDYGQSSIAVVIGNTEFIKPRTDYLK